MNGADVFIIAIILLVVSLSIYAIRKSKKEGKACIGCPDSGACPMHGSCCKK